MILRMLHNLACFKNFCWLPLAEILQKWVTLWADMVLGILLLGACPDFLPVLCPDVGPLHPSLSPWTLDIWCEIYYLKI